MAPGGVAPNVDLVVPNPGKIHRLLDGCEEIQGLLRVRLNAQVGGAAAAAEILAVPIIGGDAVDSVIVGE